MFEREVILDGLDRHAWNKSRAAAELGLSRKGLKAKIERYLLDRRRRQRGSLSADG
ncbi:MAG: helix-turn-helix domain-containing protein [Candidatus Eisenbacteria bacterium]